MTNDSRIQHLYVHTEFGLHSSGYVSAYDYYVTVVNRFH